MKGSTSTDYFEQLWGYRYYGYAGVCGSSRELMIFSKTGWECYSRQGTFTGGGARLVSVADGCRVSRVEGRCVPGA